MTFKQIVLVMIVSLFFLVSSVTPAFTSPVLIKLLPEDNNDYNKIERLNIPVYHRYNSLLIAQFEDTKLKTLDDAGLDYEIIDMEPWSTAYYAVSKSLRGEDIDLSSFGEILVQEDGFNFLKTSDEEARNLAEQGYHITKVFHRTIPVKYKSMLEPQLRSYPYDPDIDSLLSLVSEDSLYSWNLRLQNFQTRYSYSDSIHSARQWLFDKLVSFNMDSVYFHHYYYDSDQYNVVAVVVGTACQDKVIVVGEHYDSVVYGTGTNPFSWAPGADDNASGTAATLEMARIITQNPLPVTVIFVPFAQEEQGLIGSYHFAEFLYNNSVDVQLMLNADMIGHSVDAVNDVRIYGASQYLNVMIDMANTYTNLIPYYNGQSSGSDHYSFIQWGYDALFAQEGEFFYNGWHKNYDLVDSLDFSYMKEVVQMEFATLISVAKSLEPDYLVGDVNEDGEVSVTDAIYLINFLYKGGPPPPPGIGDCNNDDSTTLSDVIYLINYLFKSGPPPQCGNHI